MAYAFLTRYPNIGAAAWWFRPESGMGNHIFAATDDWAFDFHGYAPRANFMAHSARRAEQIWPGWRATLHRLPLDVLVSEAKSRSYDGLWLREPAQFLHDAMPRANAFVDRFPPPRCGR